MEKSADAIKCAKCGAAVDVDKILTGHLDEERANLSQEKVAIERQQADLESTIEARAEEKLKLEKTALQAKEREKAEADHSIFVASLQQELNEKSEQVKEFYGLQADLSKSRRETAELKGVFEAEYQAKLGEDLKDKADEVRLKTQEEYDLKLRDKVHVIEALKKDLNDATRRAEQGSVQVQGEVQEVAIEDWLRENFPIDVITSTKQGVRGADCLQRVNGPLGQECGLIYFESKRTKDFQPSWISKFKEDMQLMKADVGVLVTQSMPKGAGKIVQKEGVWVCSFEGFKGVSPVLRQMVMEVAKQKKTQQNKGEKKEMLFNYCNSNEFRLSVEGVTETFTQMKDDLQKEKSSTQKLWKKRETQIDKILTNYADITGRFEGISGTEMAHQTDLNLIAESSTTTG